jgi:hypothetical protein
MANMVLALSGKTDHFHSLRYQLAKMDRLHLGYHLLRYSHHFVLWSDLKTHRGNDPTRLIRVELYDSIF